jgi:hypothetical protein
LARAEAVRLQAAKEEAAEQNKLAADAQAKSELVTAAVDNLATTLVAKAKAEGNTELANQISDIKSESKTSPLTIAAIGFAALKLLALI